MKPKVYLQVCFLILTIFVKDINSFDFQFISTTEKPIKPSEDVVKFFLTSVEIKMQQFIQQNEKVLDNIKNEILSKIEGKEEMDKNEKQEDMVTNKKMLDEMESRIVTKIEEEETVFKKYQQEELYEKRKFLNEIETNCVAKNENESQLVGKMLEQIKIENNKQLRDIKSEILNVKEMLEEVVTRILTKIQYEENIHKKQQQEEILENKKLLKEFEANVINKIEEERKSQFQNQKQLQEMETKIINKFQDEKDVCSKQQAEIFQIGRTLETKNQKIDDKLNEVLDKVKIITVPGNCQDVLQLGYTSTGVYFIQPIKSNKTFEVLCNMDLGGGGWTYILNRFDGSQNFNLEWNDYKNGFGSLTGEFWLGLQHIHELTSGHQNCELLIELVDWENVTKYALYDNFHLGNETESYKIVSLGSYDGDAGDSLTGHISHDFSISYSFRRAGWWYFQDYSSDVSYHSHLTGVYRNIYNESYYSAVKWSGFHGYDYSLKEARMMIRHKKF